MGTLDDSTSEKVLADYLQEISKELETRAIRLINQEQQHDPGQSDDNHHEDATTMTDTIDFGQWEELLSIKAADRQEKKEEVEDQWFMELNELPEMAVSELLDFETKLDLKAFEIEVLPDSFRTLCRYKIWPPMPALILHIPVLYPNQKVGTYEVFDRDTFPVLPRMVIEEMEKDPGVHRPALITKVIEESALLKIAVGFRDGSLQYPFL